MNSSGTRNVTVDHSWMGILLFAFAILLLSAAPAQAQATDCSSFPNGVLDGFVNPLPPSSIEIDRNCTIRNYPASNPLTANFNFFTQPGQTQERWLIVFDNVVHTGNMACSSVLGHKIWFTNGSSSSIQQGCQNLLIPVEKINKQNPAGQTTATIGVPFTYKLTIPVLYDPATGTVINSSGSPNDLHGITIWDDLNETGVDLSYVSHVAYWLNNGTPVPHTFSNVGGVLTFDNIPIVSAGGQIVIELTVVLNDTPANAPGTQFTNRATWDFGRLIDGVFYQPLPGEWGITAPLTIAAPRLVVEKSGPATMALGQWNDFAIDVRNTGLSEAWDVTIRDLLPNGAGGGMCDQTPEILNARVYAADGVTPVPNKGPLNPGTDYQVSYSAAPSCRLDITMLTPAGRIGANERLIVRYRARLDADTQNGISLTNIAGAIQWFNGDDSNPGRVSYTRTLTDGTVGIADHEDAHTVTTVFTGYFFEKTVADLTSGANPATTAAPGDTLRYTLRLRNFGQALSGVRILDELDALNVPPAFAPGTLALVTSPPGADISATSSTGGSNGTGFIDIRNVSVPAGGEALIQFDVKLASALANSTVVTNQSRLLLGDGTLFAVSDDPAVNDIADPEVSGDEDPTRVTIMSAPAFRIEKISTDLTGDPDVLLSGETLRYTLTVKNIGNEHAVNVMLRDAVPLNTTYVPASTRLNGALVPDSTGQSPLVNGLLIHSPADPKPGSMPADASNSQANIATITFDVVVNPTVVNGTVISNQGFVTAPDSGITDQPSDDPRTPIANDPTRDTVMVVEPDLIVMKSGPATMNLGQWGDFAIDVHNIGLSNAVNVSIRDLLPDGATGGMCDLTPEILSAQVFAADGVTPAPGKGPLNPGSDYLLSYSAAPACRLDIRTLTAAGAIAPDERLIIRYRTQLDANTQDGIALTNVAGAIQWFNNDSSKSYTRTLTNGTVGTPDHEDAHTVTVALSGYLFEKTVANLTSGVNPTTNAGPGDTLRYTLRFQTTDQALSNFSIHDELDALNTQPAFAPGTLALVAYPAGADISGTSSTGGARGTGVIDIRNLNLPADGELLIQFDITLDSNLNNGTVIANQSTARLSAGTVAALSDDPNVNGAANPAVPGDEDPTRVTIVSTPIFVVQKISTDLTGDRNVLLAGETVRYTITAKNIGNQNAVNVVLRDSVPANTTYVAGSTTLNGVPVPDSAGVSPLVNGMLINSPAILTRGSMPADPSGNPSNTATITFDIVVNANVVNGIVISNQGFVSASDSGIIDQPSDDPRTPIANDPTRDIVTVVAAPAFVVQKISTDMTGDPAVLLAGETLRYTITVKNVGKENAVNVVLRDLVPANTTYVAGSTTLNGAAVADVGGLSPLVNGMPINPPADSMPGSMPADPSGGQVNVATITFDVVVDPNVVNGTVISNQGFVTASDTGIVDQPSDDPRTSTPNDPTRDIVGNMPLLYAEKRVDLIVDLGSPGIVDPGDVLRYTITVQNSAAVPATGVALRDIVPANTGYVADSTLLNGLPVGQPDSGVSPLASGIDISSSDRMPPLPGPGAGTISPRATAVLQFSLRVNAGTPAGTVISNQATVDSVELPDLLTDGDGNPATGPEPTVVVVGAGQQLSITKQVVVVGGGAAVPGAQLEYTIRVVNIATVPALNVLITDNLEASQPGQLAYMNGSATMNGSTAGVTFAGSTITANYAAVNGSLAPGDVVLLRFRAILAPGLAEGTAVTNTGLVAWNDPTQTASASVSLVVGGIPGVAVLKGSGWHDANFNNVRDSGERTLTGWAVDLYRDDQVLHTASMDADGIYRIVGVEPNDATGSRYELRFRAPGASANTATLGLADSPFTNGPQRISDIIVSPGAILQDLNLPIDPNGVIYNSVERIPVAGATVTLLDAGSRSPLPAACFDDAAQQGQITLADGYYKFDVNFSDPACASGGNYLIEVTAPPGANYVAGYSLIIPPASGPSTAAFSVPACPASGDDAIQGTAAYCEAQPSEFAPGASVRPRSAGTIYHVHLRLDGSGRPGTSQVFNNHIPLDPNLEGSLAISKTTPLVNVTRGQLVPYVITVNNISGRGLPDVSVIDRLPAGFTYVPGSALVDGTATEPAVGGRELRWNGLQFAGTQVLTIKLLLAVGAGVTEGEYVNRAQVLNGITGGAMSGEATATVRVMPDPTFDCTDVTGKVFNDANRNGRQDSGEDGLARVRVVTARGLQATTDQYGRYHISCAITPHESRGSNFVLKLDDRTLPSGFRMSTDQVQIRHATRGKSLRINFGASIYRVVSIDLSDAVFQPGATEIRVQWRPRLNTLIEELSKAPAALRLSYIADLEDADLVKRRVEAIKGQLTEAWNAGEYGYVLTIEPEVFWRRGAPQKQPDVRVRESR